jgi:hypothetical protein
MKLVKLAPLALAAALLAGCAGSGIQGSWKSTNEPSGSDFELGKVTFAEDGSYTATVMYADQERDDAGTWTFEDGKLTLEGHGGTRTYDAAIVDGEMVITNPESGDAVTLERQ